MSPGEMEWSELLSVPLILNLGDVPKHLAYLSRYIPIKIKISLLIDVNFQIHGFYIVFCNKVSKLFSFSSFICIGSITLSGQEHYLSYSQVVDFGSTLSWLNVFDRFVSLSRRIPLGVYNPMYIGVRFAAFIFDVCRFFT